MQRRAGTRLGKYRLDRRIGRGGFSEVWKARDTVEDRPVALKLTGPEVVREWGRDEIEREARIASRLRHPNIVAVRNADWIDGCFVLATDLAKTSLDRYPRARRSADEALRVVREIAAGLAHAHEQHVLHRDVKPENVLIYPDGRVALTDFGASRFATGTAVAVTEAGTFGYLAPEQAYGRASYASDVFSLGLIGYELLSGELPAWPFEWPFEGHRRFEARVPDPVQPVLRRAAALEPRRRWPDAGAFLAALDHALAQAREAPRRRPRRRRAETEPSPLLAQAEAFRRAHGAALELRYRCRRCSGPISEPMRHCPWCGTADNSFRHLTRHTLVCPECEKGVRPEWSFCPWCWAGRFEPNGRRPPHDPRAVRRCGRRGCAGELRPFMSYCPLCKWKPRRPWSAPGLPDRCPKCRWPTSRAFLRYCPWCGRHERRAGGFEGRRTPRLP